MMLNISFFVRTNDSILSVSPYSGTALSNVNTSYCLIVSQTVGNVAIMSVEYWSHLLFCHVVTLNHINQHSVDFLENLLF